MYRMVTGAGALVRDGRPEESSTLAVLLSQLGHEVSAAWLHAWLSNLNPATDRLLVLEQGGEPVGVGVVHLTPLAHEADHRARLTALVIDGRVRSRGLGAKLLTACEEAAQSMRCSSLELTTASWRQDAHRFYERQGYAVVSRRYSKLLR